MKFIEIGRKDTYVRTFLDNNGHSRGYSFILVPSITSMVLEVLHFQNCYGRFYTEESWQSHYFQAISRAIHAD